MSKSIFIFLSILFVAYSVNCQTTDIEILKSGLVIKLDRSQNRGIISPNDVVASVETGNWETPSENDKVYSNDKVVGIWRKITSDDNGWFRSDSLWNAFVYFNYKSDKEGIAILEAMGNEMVYVNGVARSGNPYGYQDTYEEWAPRFDYSLIPVKLKKGNNEFLFACNRSLLKVKIHTNKKGLIFNNNDLTVPDLIIMEHCRLSTQQRIIIKTWQLKLGQATPNLSSTR